jgi:hypothetical protein
MKMNRKSFLGSLAASIAGMMMSGTLKAAIKPSNSICILAAELRGLHYYDYKKTKGLLQIGDKLQLKAEPTNPHDAQAVEVYLGEYKLGYLPREHNLASANFLAEDIHLEAEIYYLDKWVVGVEVRVSL